MTNYTRILMHNSTADIEKRKGLVRNYRSALNEEQDYDMGLDKQKTDITEAQRDQQKKNREALTSSEKAINAGKSTINSMKSGLSSLASSISSGFNKLKSLF